MGVLEVEAVEAGKGGVQNSVHQQVPPQQLVHTPAPSARENVDPLTIYHWGEYGTVKCIYSSVTHQNPLSHTPTQTNIWCEMINRTLI